MLILEVMDAVGVGWTVELLLEKLDVDDGAGMIAVVLLLDGVTLGVAVVVTIIVILSVGVIEMVVAPDEKNELLLDSTIVEIAEGVVELTVVVLSFFKYDLVAMIGTLIVAVRLPIFKIIKNIKKTF